MTPQPRRRLADLRAFAAWRQIRLHHIVVPITAFLATLPLILHGASCGHDFDFHILNWMEAARQFAHGNLHPHWAYTPAYNAGEPRFVFYPPLSWTLGAILSFIMPWTWTPIAYTWVALTAAGLALHRLAREFANSTSALIAASLYVVNPYALFTAYERTAYAELLSVAWIPLLLLAILRKKVTVPGIAIPVALLWLTDAPAAVMSCYILALLTVIRLFQTDEGSRLQMAATTTAGTLLGLGLAAFYIVPAAYERRYVQVAMAILPEMSIPDNFLFGNSPDPVHDAVLHTASMLAVLLLVLTAIVLAMAFASLAARSSKRLVCTLSILTITIAFLLTPISNFIWQHLPELKFLQFPWRLLAILAAVLALGISFVLKPLKLKPVVTAALALALAATLAFHSYSLRQQSCDEEDTVAARLALFYSGAGTDPTDEYTPTIADNDVLSKTNPPFWLIPARSDANQAAPANSKPGPAPTHLTLSSSEPEILVLNLRDYPAWRITLNQTPVTTRLDRNDGLIAFPIPAGLSHIGITYLHTMDQTVGDILTALSLVIFLIALLSDRFGRKCIASTSQHP